MVKGPQHTPNPTLRFFRSMGELPKRFRSYLVAIGLFGIGDFSQSLPFVTTTLLLWESLGIVKDAQVTGLLYVGRNVVQVAVYYPGGFVADRVTHLNVVTDGYVLGVFMAVFAALLFWFGEGSIPLFLFFIAGFYMAVQETLESTEMAEMVHTETLALSCGVLR